MAGPAKPPPRLDPGKTGLRKRGQKTGGPHLTVGQTEVVEAYWSASSADLVQLTRDGTPVGDPDRATDQSLPLPHGLAAGDYTFKLVPGVLGGEKPVWSGDAGVDLKLTVKETVLVNKFWITPEPADGHADLAHALQLRNGTKVKLHWSTTGAKKVAILTSTGEFFELDAGPGGAGEFLHDPKDQPGKYKLRALNGEAQSRPATPISIFFHPARMTMSPLTSVGVSDAGLTVLSFHQTGDEDEEPGLDDRFAEHRPTVNKLGAGAGDEVKLQWSVLRATKARLTAKLLTPRKAPPEPGATHGQIGNLALAQGGLALALDEHGSGSGVVTIHPGPTGTTTYALEVTTAAGKKSLTTKVEVANFNLQLLLPDGAGQGGLDCVLEVPGLPPFKGQTRVDGVLWLSLPNLAAPSAKLRMLDGSREIARWMLQLVPEAGLKEVPAGKGKPAAGSVRIALGTKAGPLRAAPSPHDAGHPKLVALRMLHARYLSVLDENAAWMREQAAKKFVAEWCDALVHEKKSAAWIDRGRLEEFKQAFAAESLARQLTLDVAGRALTSQLDDPELIEVLNDLGYRGACERSVSVQGLGESLAGSAWIERELEKESTGFLHLIANAYTVQGATELSDQVDLFKKRNFDTVEPWADALAEFAGTFTRVHGEDTVEEAAKVIGRRFGMPASELIGLEHLLTAQGARGALLVERRVMVLEVSKVAVAGKAAKKVIEGLAKVATVINIATKVNLVFKDPKLQNLLGTGAALLELLGAFSERFNEGANRLFRALMRTGRQVDIEGLPKAAELVTLRVGEAEGGLVLRTLAEKADAIAALSGLIDAVTGTLDAIEDYKKGDMAGALGKVAVAAGGAMVALAGTLFTLSATSAELPPLAGILFIMGTLIGLVGILIGSAYGASEMELWARHSAFGINARGHELEEQIRELNDLLYTVRIQGILQWKRSDEGSLALKIEPALLSELSKVRLKIVLKAAGQKDWPLLDALLVDRPTLEQEDTRLLQADFAYAEKEGALPGFEHPLPIRSIGLRTRTPLSSHEWSAAEVTLTIDPDGSGAGLKRSATIGTGLGEWVKLHEAT